MNRKLYIETYGCQMNLNDSEIVAGIMQGNGWELKQSIDNAVRIQIGNQTGDCQPCHAFPPFQLCFFVNQETQEFFKLPDKG